MTKISYGVARGRQRPVVVVNCREVEGGDKEVIDNAHFVYIRVALFVYFIYYLVMFISIFTLICY